MNKYLLTYKPEGQETKSMFCYDFSDLIRMFKFIIKTFPGADIEVFELTKIY